MAKKIFIIEDEKEIGDLLELYLKKEGYDVQKAQDGETGFRRISKEPFDLLILDLLLPNLDGLEICRMIRSQRQNVQLPIIMVTAKGEVADRVVGLEMGADDYVTKPFSPRELMARVKALLRRMNKAKAKEAMYEYKGILLDLERYEASFQGKAQILTAKEFKLLEYLLANKGRLLSRDHLLNAIWGYDYFGTTRTVDVHIARLRQKFPILARALVAVAGIGYKLQEEPGR